MIEERIAKLIARSGACSRRDAEKIIAEGRVTYKNQVILEPSTKFTSLDSIKIDGIKLVKPSSKLWLYHKPIGLVVSHKDEQGRPTVFDNIPITERVISVGRLDKNTSGLLLLTNDGEIARKFELPSNNFKRVYMVRVYGDLNFRALREALSRAIIIEGITYQPVEIELAQSGPNNNWLRMSITEGKNREIRRILEYFNLSINRLIRIQYGPYELGDLKLGAICEVTNFLS